MGLGAIIGGIGKTIGTATSFKNLLGLGSGNWEEQMVKLYEAESIEEKVRRIVNENEPIEDGAPIIFQERIDGVKPEFNIRTDRWEVAIEAMDKVSAEELSRYTKSQEKPGEGIEKIGRAHV